MKLTTEPDYLKQINFGYHAKISPYERQKYQENIYNLCKLMKEQKEVLGKIMAKERAFLDFFDNFIKNVENKKIDKKKLLARGRWSNIVISSVYSHFKAFLRKIKRGTADFSKNLYKTKLDRNLLDDCLNYIYEHNCSDFFKTTYNMYFFYRNETANEITPFVISIATKYRRYGSDGDDIDDLIQAGLIGVLKGLEVYDTEKNVKITTYLDFWIKEVIQRFIKNDELIHIPENVRGIRRIAKSLGYDGYKEISDDDIKTIHKKTRASKELIQEVVYNQEFIESIESNICQEKDNGKGDMRTIEDILTDENELSIPDNLLEQSLLREEVENILKLLNEKEKAIICERFGLMGYAQGSLSEVGKKFKISRERVRQIELRAIKKIRNHLKKVGENYGKI